MLTKVKEFERYVSQGFVLDKKGQWLPIDEAVAEEIEFLRHLENGEVLENGQWVNLDDIIKRETSLPVTEKPVSEQSIETDDKNQKPETEQVTTPEEDVTATLPADEPVIAPAPPTEESETDNQETVKVQTGPMDTVIMEDAQVAEDIMEEIPETTHEDIQRAEDDDSETRRFELDATQLEMAQTKVIDKESVGIPEQEPVETEDVLLSTDEFESVISEMEQGEIEGIDEESDVAHEDVLETPDTESSSPPLPEKSPLTTKPLSTEPAVPFTTESQDEWDRARSRNLKIIIGSVAGGVILIIFVIVKFLL